jgi:hypothetical protein
MREVPVILAVQDTTEFHLNQWIAKLGGYLGRTRDRPPGTTVLWRGFLALHETSQMYWIF